MMLSYLVIAALMPAMVSSFVGNVPAPTHAAGHHIEKQNPYMLIAKELGDVWSKLLLARVVSENSDFSGDSSTVAEKVQELADEITNHSAMNVGNMKEKAKNVLTEMQTLQSNYKPISKSDMRYKPSDSKVAEYVNETVEISHKIMEMMGGLQDPKGKVPAPTHAAEHHVEEQNPYMLIAKELGDVWSKLLLARVVSENSDFSGDSSTAAEKVQELADEITNHYDMNIGNMKEKAKNVLTEMQTLQSNYKPISKSDMHYKPSDNKIAEYVNETVEISHKIMEKMGGLQDPQHAKNGNH